MFVGKHCNYESTFSCESFCRPDLWTYGYIYVHSITKCHLYICFFILFLYFRCVKKLIRFVFWFLQEGAVRDSSAARAVSTYFTFDIWIDNILFFFRITSYLWSPWPLALLRAMLKYVRIICIFLLDLQFPCLFEQLCKLLLRAKADPNVVGCLYRTEFLIWIHADAGGWSALILHASQQRYEKAVSSWARCCFHKLTGYCESADQSWC